MADRPRDPWWDDELRVAKGIATACLFGCWFWLACLFVWLAVRQGLLW